MRCIKPGIRVLTASLRLRVLPVHLADRPKLRERFEPRSKNHRQPESSAHLALHDIGSQDDIDFLVMEYLEGETLAARLSRGSLPLSQVLTSAIEISDALDKAHRKGMTHRDLKPGNIMLTKSGTKLLDFGLAKLKQEVAPTVPLSRARHRGPGSTDGGREQSQARFNTWLRSSRRQGGRCAHRHLCVWRSSVRDGDGQARVRGQRGRPASW